MSLKFLLAEVLLICVIWVHFVIVVKLRKCRLFDMKHKNLRTKLKSLHGLCWQLECKCDKADPKLLDIFSNPRWISRIYMSPGLWGALVSSTTHGFISQRNCFCFFWPDWVSADRRWRLEVIINLSLVPHCTTCFFLYINWLKKRSWALNLSVLCPLPKEI